MESQANRDPVETSASRVATTDFVIPVYNEAHVLEASVDRLFDAIDDRVGFDWRVVIIDNGSVDGTDRIGEGLSRSNDNLRFRRLEEKGRGRALRTAWNETDADFSIYMDVDLSTDLAAVPQTVSLLQEGADVVTGSRLHPRSQTKRSLKREILSRGYNALIRWVLGTRCFQDAQCGFKGVRVETVRRVLPLVKNENWFFDTELLVLAEYIGLRVAQIPIHWGEDADSRVKIVPTVWEDVKGITRLRLTARSLLRQIAQVTISDPSMGVSQESE